MKTAIQHAIQTSINENRTVVCEVNRPLMDRAALAVEVHAVWMEMRPDDSAADTDWNADKDGDALVWGWDEKNENGGEALWTIIIR